MHATEMKELALVAIFLMTGCASSNARTSDTDPGIAQLEQKRRAVDESEKKCVDEALQRSHDQTANDARDNQVSQCHAWADQQDVQIANQERSEYESEAQDERNRAAFMAVLTTSRLH
jgi:hypothetical protein